MRASVIRPLCIFTTALLNLALACNAFASDKAIERWAKSAESIALRNVIIEMTNSEYSVDQLADVQSHPPSTKSFLRVRRNGAVWHARIDINLPAENASKRLETLVDDQLLRLQAVRTGGLDQFENMSAKATGRLQSSQAEQANALHTWNARFIFGFVSDDDTATPLPVRLLSLTPKAERPVDGMVFSEYQLPGKKVMVREQENGLLSELRVIGDKVEIRVFDIQWTEYDETSLPSNYKIATLPRQRSSSRISVATSVVDSVAFGEAPSHLTTDWEVPDGTKVGVNDVPFLCEYVNGRIVPAVDRDAGLTNRRFTRSESRTNLYLLSLSLFAATGLVIYSWNRRRKS